MKDLRYYVHADVTSWGETGEGAQTTHDVYEAQLERPARRIAGDRATMCDECGESFRVSETRIFRGVVYGVPCGCARAIPREILKPHAQDPPRRRGHEVESPILTEAAED